ncbi:heme oxygenase [Bacillus sp. B1-b2]|uniref:heme oxygenase n=1 Tax=Bacillus sp. B1-b2 TaxID=2653201 RepID=UPI00126142CE|nr:heme oxygenase [Bacillus sp. B1-b2]KAB7665631.1 heme oxygenase [Bacillus sp. B1-b2]
MYIVTNTVKVETGFADGFVERFNRVGKIETKEGFVGLEVLLTSNTKGYEEITIVTRWENKEGFLGWVGSEEFKESHAHRDGMPPFIIENKTTHYEVKVQRKPLTGEVAAN